MFELSIWTFVIVCPLVFIGGFVDSIAGGGGLITLPTYLAAGLPSHMAISTNKLSSTIGTTVATVRYFKKGFVNIKIAIISVILALIGSSIGSSLVMLVDDGVLKIVLIVLLPITSVFVLVNKGLKKERESFSLLKTIVISGIIAFFIGAYDGFYGPGTGTILLILLTFFAHMTLESANGTAKCINFASNIAATVIFLIQGQPLLILGLVAGAFNAAGNFFGSKLFIDKGIKIVKPMMIVVLILLFAKVIYDLFV